ncbi:MAG: acetylglutamate kinase [Spirochaetaceae bacterium]|jgi:acetylglutamate kinase|nr:acetylglutamate kinase [Spirochaetaceae bacterium]
MKDFVGTNNDRAQVLVHALPYIQEYRNKTVIVKYGGNAMINEDVKNAVIHDLILMACVGIRTVLVHGGGPEIDAMLKTMGKESRFVQGLRYTDEETMEIVQMVLCGKINKDIVSLIQQSGGRALGICGIDGGLLKAHRLKAPDLGLVGEIEAVDTAVINAILDLGAIPVVSSVALGVSDAEGMILNINADTAAATIAVALHAEKLILMTDVQGILHDLHDPASLIKVTKRSDLVSLKQNGTVSKGMLPKIDCCIAALDGGVKKTHIIDGRLPHALLIELFTDEGIGTMIVA